MITLTNSWIYFNSHCEATFKICIYLKTSLNPLITSICFIVVAFTLLPLLEINHVYIDIGHKI